MIDCIIYFNIIDKISSYELNHIKNRLPSIRTFEKDFATSYCPINNNNKGMNIPQQLKAHFPKLQLKPIDSNNINDPTCDIYYNESVVIISHDSILNLGHMFEDILNVFLTLELNNLDSKNINLLNIDGLRPGNILKGSGHHILDTLYQDSFGSFQQIYQTLFKSIISVSEIWGKRTLISDETIPGKKVCFTNKVYMFPMPLKAFLWDKFEIIDECSLQLQPSYIYRKFITIYQNYWNKYSNLIQLKQQISNNNVIQYFSSINNHSNSNINSISMIKKDIFRILLITRKQVTSSNTNEIKARAFANSNEIIEMIKLKILTNSYQNVMNMDMNIELYVCDFEDITFEMQVALANSIDLMIGFHGAGMNHFFHLDYQRKQ